MIPVLLLQLLPFIPTSNGGKLKNEPYMTIAGVMITEDMIPVLKVKHKDNSDVAALANSKAPQSNSHRNISDLLDSLLSDYDNSIRPDFGGPPAVVEVDIMVRSMGPISEVDMTYSMDCYFRQSWVDRRLSFKGTKEPLALSVSMLRKIWKPDTYFYNGKQSYLHTITTPNKLVRLFQDGRVLYSSRLTIKAGCPMDLEDFPMDTQRCPLKFGSFGYTTNDVIYRWNVNRQVIIADDMKLSQFDLIDTPSANHTDKIHIAHSKEYAVPTDNVYTDTVFEGVKRCHNCAVVSRFNTPGHTTDIGVHFMCGKAGRRTKLNPADQSRFKAADNLVVCTVPVGKHGEYSMLLVSFHLQRHMGNFLIQVYGPCILLVVLSWVSFWLNREATADRVSLGITTVLTMTFLGLEARTDLPKVPYPTALDFFVFLSFSFIFATIIQFAFVHYFTKYGSGECYFSMDLNSDSSSDEEDIQSWVERPGKLSVVEFIPLSSYTVPLHPMVQRPPPTPRRSSLSCCTPTEPEVPVKQKPKIEPRPPRKVSISSLTGSITHALRNLNSPRPSVLGTARRKKKKRTPRFNSVSKIDKASRIVFPLLFGAINAFYWYSYLSRSQRMLKSSKD